MAIEFQKDEYVKYGTTGVCRVDGVKDISFSNKKDDSRPYYVLKPISSSSSTVYVPLGNSYLLSQMRYLMSKKEIDELISEIKGKSIEWIEDRKERPICFNKIISDGDEGKLMMLAECLHSKKVELQSNGKKLSASDEKILGDTEKLITEEFAFSLNLNNEQVGTYIRDMLNA